jgi:glucose/arabinose dehydrogenase
MDRARRPWAALALALLISGAGYAAGLPVAAAAGPTPSPRPKVEVFASGLVRPRGLAFGPDGSLYVAEAGLGGERQIDLGLEKPHTLGFSGRVSRISSAGERTTVVDGLPSTVTAEGDPVGPTGVAFLGDQLYLLTASGGGEVGDPAFHNAVERIAADGRREQILDYSAYLRDVPTRARREDPRADVPMGMPYGMTALDGRLYTTDGNQEVVLEVEPTGAVRRVIEYPKSNRALTGIAVGPDGALYVAQLAAFKIVRLETDGTSSDVATGLRAPIAVAFDGAGFVYYLEHYSGLLLRFPMDNPERRETVVSDLKEPTALALGPDGNLYVSTYGGNRSTVEGRIERVRLADQQPVSQVTGAATRGLTWGAIGGGLAALLAVASLGIWWRGWRRRARRQEASVSRTAASTSG